MVGTGLRRVALVQIGVGTVGGAVVAQAIANRERWCRVLGLDLRVAALVGRSGALVSGDGSPLPDAVLRAALAARRAGRTLADVAAEHGGLALVDAEAAIDRTAAAGPTVVSDAAAGEATARLDAHALSLGAGVVLSNKAPLSLPMGDPFGAALWAAAGPGGRVRYEATCGAGLPVISTLRTLLDTGDDPREIVGALSGTLGAIFSDVAAGSPFSAAVRAARENGYTEPDPRDDLSGLDVARKALILARTLGRRVDLDEVEVESLVPEDLREGTVDAFLTGVATLDAAMAERAAAATAAGRTLKYVATVRPEGPLAVGVRPVSTATVLGALQGPENIVSMRTARYDTYPCVVSGPGAGAAVTAAGMLGDVLALAGNPVAPLAAGA